MGLDQRLKLTISGRNNVIDKIWCPYDKEPIDVHSVEEIDIFEWRKEYFIDDFFLNKLQDDDWVEREWLLELADILDNPDKYIEDNHIVINDYNKIDLAAGNHETAQKLRWVIEYIERQEALDKWVDIYYERWA